MTEKQRKGGRQTSWEGEGGEPTGFGRWLRRERELREVSIAEIAETTKISKSYLEALESERFDVLPAPVFAKGFLREYARYVGLDPDEVVNSYLTARDEEDGNATVEVAASDSGGSFDWRWGALLVAGLLLLLGAVGFLGFWAERSQTEGATAPVEDEPTAREPAAAAEPPSTPPPTTTPADDPSLAAPAEAVDSDGGGEPERTGGNRTAATEPAAPLVVTLDFTEDCWVEIEVDGRRRLSELHVQGESLQIDAQSSVSLTLGNPEGVRVEVNGEPRYLGPFRPNRVARDLLITLDEPAGEEAGE